MPLTRVEGNRYLSSASHMWLSSLRMLLCGVNTLTYSKAHRIELRFVAGNLKVHCAFFELRLDDLLPTCVFWSCCRANSTCKRDISLCETDRFGSFTFPPSAIRYQHTISNYNLLIRGGIFLSDISSHR